MQMNTFFLKNLIRQVISEMSFKGVMPTATYGDLAVNKDASGPSSFQGVDRFHRTPSFLKKAEWAFRNFSYDVWILPAYSADKKGELGRNQRWGLFEPQEGLKLLADMQLNTDWRALYDVLEEGGLVIVSNVRELVAGGLTTPWMIIHAIFDGLGGTEKLTFDDSKDEIVKIVRGLAGSADQALVIDSMTMKSGGPRPGGERAISTDAGNENYIAEILTQAVLGKGDNVGVKFDVTEEAVADYFTRVGMKPSDKSKADIARFKRSHEFFKRKFAVAEKLINAENLHQQVIDAFAATEGKILIVNTFS